MKRAKFVLIDGHALIHRAYHAIPPLTTKTGELVNAVYGFSAIILNVLRDLKPEYVAVAMDLPGKTFRHHDYADYKATRKKADDELIAQFGRVREVISALNIPIYEQEGYEADDIIGSAAEKLKKDHDVYIVTGDLDELQLVDDNVRVYTMKRGFTDTFIYDKAAVLERYGLTPAEFIVFKALKGDASDNIPGVAGIGEKTASELVSTYKTLDSIYEHLDELKPALAKKLTDNKDNANLSLHLSKIVTDIPVNVCVNDCATHEYDRNVVFELFRELEFKSLLAKLPPQLSSSSEAKDPEILHVVQTDKERGGNDAVSPGRAHYTKDNYHLVDSIEKTEKLVQELEKQKLIAIDTETNSLDSISAKLVGVSISYKEGEAYYIPAKYVNNLKPIIENENISKVGHNIKFDYEVFAGNGYHLSGIVFDTMVAAYLINPNARAQRLEELAFTELGLEMTKIEELIGKGKNQITFDLVTEEEATLYACEDADMTLRLYHHLSKDLDKGGFNELMAKIEAPLIEILAKIEIAGVKIDEKLLAALSLKFGKRLDILEAEIFKSVGSEFNISSPAQLQKVLFDTLRLHEKLEKNAIKKLPSGGLSTGAEELEKLRGTHPIIEKIFEYRELSKLKNTYVDALPKLVNSKTGRIHTSFNQAIAATGRLSSTNPNLQNIPVRTETGMEIRKSFIAEDGFMIMSADYSQIELRIIAHMSGDAVMMKAFRDGLDIHTATAAKVYGVSEDKVTKEMRRTAKVVNFGIVYGVSAHGLQRQSTLTYGQAKDFIDKYFQTHASIRTYLDDVVKVARERGFAETLFGRRRYLPELTSSNFAVRGAAERMAANMPIQGTAADLIKLAMIEIDKGLKNISPDSRMILTVHDELVFEVPEMDVNKVRNFVKNIMENVVKLDVPVTVEVGVGNNWRDAK